MHPPEKSGQQSMISVTEVSSEAEWLDVRKLLLPRLKRLVEGAGAEWLESLRRGSDPKIGEKPAEPQHSWVYCARDRAGHNRGAAIVSTKKGESLKVMPIIAADAEAFRALVLDLPVLLAGKGRKAYIHHVPSADEVGALQDSGWALEAQLPHAYRRDVVTQQWGWQLDHSAEPKRLRIQQRYLSMIAAGEKTLEVRVGYEHIKRIQAGDVLRFVSGQNSTTCQVSAVRTYPDFYAMLRDEDVKRALPGTTVTDALAQLREIYPPEKERLGVVVIELSRQAPDDETIPIE